MKETKRKRLGRLAALLVCIGCTLSLLAASAGAASFRYKHDPRLNLRAMQDIVADPDAAYGFAPSPYGSLAQYVDAVDWSDAAALENGRDERIAYHKSLEGMYVVLENMRAEGSTTEEIARTVSRMRNEIRMLAYAEDPEGLETAKARNLEQYGHEDGPTPDELYARYGSWETVIEKAFSANPGMDACLGLYDDYYSLYITVGQIPEEDRQSAAREYAVAVFVSTAGVEKKDSGRSLSDFEDGDYVSTWFEPELSTAVSAGVLRGYEDGTLRPRESIRRIEAFVVLSRCLPTLQAVREPIAFTDVPAWAQADIDRLSAAGIVNGYGDGVLGSQDDLTVYQVGLLADRIEAAVQTTPEQTAPAQTTSEQTPPVWIENRELVIADDRYVTAAFEKKYAVSGNKFCVELEVQNKTDKTMWAYLDNASVNGEPVAVEIISELSPYIMPGKSERQKFGISFAALSIGKVDDVRSMTFDLVLVYQDGTNAGEVERIRSISLDF